MKRLTFLEVFQDKTGGNPKLQTSEYQNSGLFPIIDQGRGLVAGYTNDESVVASVTLPVIIFGDHTRALKYVNEPFVLGADGTKVLVPRSDGDSKYLYHYLRSVEIPSAGYSRHYKFLKEISVPFPGQDEQRRIASILDTADELRTQRRQALAHLDTLTQSIFSSMFGVDESSKTMSLAEVVAPGTIVTYGIVQAGDEYPGGVPYIRTGDLSGGVISPDKLRHTDPQIAAKFARSKVSTGDIVMSIRATVGTVALTPESLDGANLTQGTARIAPGPQLTGAYLLEYLRGPTPQRWIWRHVKGATFKEITLQKLRQLPVSVPPLERQQAFATRVAAVERLKESHRKHLAELDVLFASLQHRAFNGEL